MLKFCEVVLPEGYEEVYSIDATNKKVCVVLNAVAIIIMLAIIIPTAVIINPTGCAADSGFRQAFISIAVMLSYVFLHELIHGIAYKILTKQKLTFGLTPWYAYCGVPDVYVYRPATLIALLAPFVVLSMIFIIAAIRISDPWGKFFAIIIFSAHLGGCCGDLYNTVLYVFRFRDNGILTRDIGLKQIFYQKMSS